MKKTLLTTIAMLALTSAFAQQKGDISLNGSIGYDITNSATKNDNLIIKQKGDRNFRFTAGADYFIIDNLSVGLDLSYDLGMNPKTIGDDTLFSKTGIFAIIPNVSYHIKLCDRLYYTPEFEIGIGFGENSEPINASQRIKSGFTVFSMALNPAKIEFRPIDNLGLTLSFGSVRYTSTFAKEGDASVTYDNFGFDILGSANIGVRFYL